MPLHPVQARVPPRFCLLSVAAFLLFALVFALFSPSVRYGFVALDDPLYVAENDMVASGLSLPSLRTAFAGGFHAGMYIPLLWVSFMADVTLFGASAGNPAPFHVVNVVLHSANAVLFFFLLLRIFRHLCPASAEPRNPDPGILLPFLLAILWAVHPLRVESVAWITERKDVLSLFFSLLSLFAYLHAAGNPRPRVARVFLFLFAFSAFAAALLVKPSLIPFPVLLLLLDVLVLRRPLSFRVALGKLPWLLLAAAAALSTLHGHQGTAIPLPWNIRMGHLPQVLFYYIRVTFFPVRLTLFEPAPSFAVLPSLFAAGALAAFLFLAFRLRRAAPAATLGILWFFLFLLPVSGIVPIPNAAVVDRFTYIPALGLSIALLPLCTPGGFSSPLRRASVLLALVVLAALALSTSRLLPVWRSSDALFGRIRRFSPSNRFLAVYDIRRAITGSGDFPAARRIAAKAMECNPDDPTLPIHLAIAIANTDGPEPAFEFLARHPPSAGEFLGKWGWEMAQLALRLGRNDDAIAYAGFALQNLSAAPTVHLQPNVRRLLTAASSPDPADALPHYISQWMIYERADALEFFRRFVDANPSRPDILANIAWILATANWSPAPPSEALGYASRALSLVPSPPPPELLDTVAAAQANASDFPSAVATQERAISLLPPGSPSLPDYQARLALYRQSLPYRHDIGIAW